MGIAGFDICGNRRSSACRRDGGRPTADHAALPRHRQKHLFHWLVTAANKIIVLLASGPQNSLIDREVEILNSPAGRPPAPFTRTDLSRQIGRVVMLDGVGDEQI